MAVSTFKDLNEHAGHHVEVNTYVDKVHNIVVNVAVECMDCNCVLFDFDNENFSKELVDWEMVQSCSDEDPEFGKDEWVTDAKDGDTDLGYWDWVKHRREFYKENPQYKH